MNGSGSTVWQPLNHCPPKSSRRRLPLTRFRLQAWTFRATVERMWHIKESHDQILAVAFRRKSLQDNSSCSFWLGSGTDLPPVHGQWDTARFNRYEMYMTHLCSVWGAVFAVRLEEPADHLHVPALGGPRAAPLPPRPPRRVAPGNTYKYIISYIYIIYIYIYILYIYIYKDR